MKGQQLWEKAKKLIPGGNMLLSKRPEMFLPESWPTYFEKTKGCHVWDVDGRKYKDMSIMGIGTNILGYSKKEVDDAVRRVINKGNMSTLNCYEEVALAEKLVELHPWANMVRFARTGGEANAIAVRIARAYTNKEKVAICGYHGWHDWYLATNLTGTQSLEPHLLPGLHPNGVPKSLKGTTIPFQYNDTEEIENLFREHDVGVVKMEVQRNEKPRNGYLERIRELCDQNQAILIFDECTSGFREVMGGLHLKYGVNPDIAMFGKALGNGYAITAVVGKSEIMQATQKTFISSTFWTERIGPAAALKALELMEKTNSYTYITNQGITLKSIWRELFSKYDLDIDVGGLDALATFKIKAIHHLSAKTYITQEMLKKGWLASDKCYLSTAHNDNIIDKYQKDLEPIISNIAAASISGKGVGCLLDGPICHDGFKRLN